MSLLTGGSSSSRLRPAGCAVSSRGPGPARSVCHAAAWPQSRGYAAKWSFRCAEKWLLRTKKLLL